MHDSPASRRVILQGIGLQGIALAACHAALPSPVRAGGAPRVSESGLVGQSVVTATLMERMRPAGTLQADVALHVEAVARRAAVAARLPVLRDAWRAAAQEYAAAWFIRGRPPDAEMLRNRLQAATDRVIGAGIARALVLSVMVR